MGDDSSKPPETLIASPLIHALAADGAATIEASVGLAVTPQGEPVRSVTPSPVQPTLTPDATIVAQSVPAQPFASTERLTEPEMRALLAAVGFPPETWAKALAVAYCESQWNPNATGSEGERGLWQIHPRWHPDSTYDPLGNARAAYRISGGGYDWSAWSCGR